MDMADAGPELEAELLAFCRASISHVKAPRSIDFMAELPRYPTGKLYKRLLRECYRLNKKILLDNFDKPYAMMFFYQSKEAMTFAEMNEKTVQLFEKFIKEIQS